MPLPMIRCPKCDSQFRSDLEECRFCKYPIRSRSKVNRRDQVSKANSNCVTCGLRFHPADRSTRECPDCDPVASSVEETIPLEISALGSGTYPDRSNRSGFRDALIIAFFAGATIGLIGIALQEEPPTGERFIAGSLASGLVFTVLVAIVYGFFISLKPNPDASTGSVNVSLLSPEQHMSASRPPTTVVSLADELTKLGKLKKQGLLSEAEFQTAKSKLLS
jgi:hypothetical protein